MQFGLLKLLSCIIVSHNVTPELKYSNNFNTIGDSMCLLWKGSQYYIPCM